MIKIEEVMKIVEGNKEVQNIPMYLLYEGGKVYFVGYRSKDSIEEVNEVMLRRKEEVDEVLRITEYDVYIEEVLGKKNVDGFTIGKGLLLNKESNKAEWVDGLVMRSKWSGDINGVRDKWKPYFY